MGETECIARKWGSSLGIIIPKKIVENQRINENEKIVITIRKKHSAKEFFGILSDWKKPTNEIKREMKKGWD